MSMILGTAVLTLVYCLALGSTHPWDIGFGVLIGSGLLYAFRAFLFLETPSSPRSVIARAIHFPMLIIAIVFDIIKGTVDVAKVVLSPDITNQGGMVEIPGDQRTRSGVIVSGLINTISPGSVVVDIDPQTLNWTIHVVDLSHPEDVIARQQSFYHRFQRPVWP